MASRERNGIAGAPFGDRLLRLILEASPDLIYVYDRLESRYVFFSSSSTMMLGYTPEQLIGLRSEDIQSRIHPDDLAYAQAHYAKQEWMSDANVSMATYRVRHASGHYKLIRCRQKVISRAADGKTAKCILGVGTDITEGAKRKSELKKLRARVLRIRDAERQRIALHMHDTAMQHLVGTALHLKSIEPHLEGSSDISSLVEARASLSRALREMLQPLQE